jgi:hypothetical protein
MRSAADAPSARASTSCNGSTWKSFLRTGTRPPVAAIASVTSAACPPNLEGSVRIDSAAAPPAA